MRAVSLLRSSPLLILLGWNPFALAQQNPNLERGVSPGKAYLVGDLDTVNLFNGTLNLRIPLGQRYHVNGNLSYGFALHYASNAWEYGEHLEVIGGFHTITYNFTYPARRNNAGFGWRLSLGELRLGISGEPGTYVSPDGAEHLFYTTLHENNPEEQSYSGMDPVWAKYTRDGTYLRLRKRPVSGSNYYELNFPDGGVHNFGLDGKLQSMSDAFGNSVTIAYGTWNSPGGQAAKWTISDSVGRQHFLYFRPSWTYQEVGEFAPIGDPVNVPHEVIDSVDLAAFDDNDQDGVDVRAVYQFSYNSLPGGTAIPLSRRCVERQDPEVAQTVVVSMLTSIDMPEGLRFQFSYDMGNQTGCSNALFAGASGNVTVLGLPTNGSIRWDYMRYRFPSSEWEDRTFFINNTGVKSRRVFDTNGTTVLSEMEYLPDEMIGNHPERHVKRRVTNKNGGEIVNATDHYFTVCASSALCESPGEYGLPLSRVGYSFPPFLSTKFLAPDANGILVEKRSSYLTYEADGNLATTCSTCEINRRVKFQTTIFEDNVIADVSYSKFDGVGNYRESATGGTFPRGNFRTTFVNFNPALGEFIVNASGQLTSAFAMVPATADWILNVYDTQRVTEREDLLDPGVTASTGVCFDSKGFMTSRRVFRDYGVSPAPSVRDRFEVFTRDVLGNRTREQFMGGEVGIQAPSSHSCGTTYSSETYRIDFKYNFGALEASYYVSELGSPLSFLNSDQKIDRNTSFVKSSWDLSTLTAAGVSNRDGLQTNYTYDRLGRLTTVMPVGTNRGASTHHVYTLNPPKLQSSERSTDAGAELLRDTSTDFDVLGRPVRETRAMPGQTAVREMQYNWLGWKTAVSEWGAPGTTPPMTRYEYDAWGRPTKIRAPDGSEASLVYFGQARVDRSIPVRTGGDASTFSATTATTSEYHDRQSRLWKVVEPDNTVTTYSYDVGARLKEVCANPAGAVCGQQRLFTYDNRGFLGEEMHPEKGVNGGGSTRYPEYDARGKARRRVDGVDFSHFDVKFDFDRAERLGRVYQTTGRTLKLFEYGTSNPGGDYRNGRVIRATRFNWLDAHNINSQVFEDYVYQERDGQVSARYTSHKACDIASGICNTPQAGFDQRFSQTFTYHPLGGPATVGSPICTHPACNGTGGQRTATYGYSNGFLNSVAWTGAPKSTTISYHRSGLVSQIAHANDVVDQIEIDPLGVTTRPRLLRTTNAIDGGACVTPSFSQQPQAQPPTITSGASVTLSALAQGQAGLTVSHIWYRGLPGDRLVQQGTGPSIVVTPSQTTSYWVEAINGCSPSGTVSVGVTVNVCTPPSMTLQPVGTSITRGQSWVVSGDAAGSSELRFQWYTVGLASSLFAINGETNRTMTVSPSTTTTYKLKVENDCGSLWSSEATVNVADPPTTPMNLTAFRNGTSARVSWSASSSTQGIHHYELLRNDGAVFSVLPAVTTYDDTSAIFGNAYTYRVRAVDGNLYPSDYSERDLVTLVTFSDDPLIQDASPIRGSHIGELRQAVDAVRRAASLSVAWSNYGPVSGAILGLYTRDLRLRLNEARQVLQLPHMFFTDDALVANATRIQAIHVFELREGMK